LSQVSGLPAIYPCSFCRVQQLRDGYRPSTHVYTFAGSFIEVVSRFVGTPYGSYPIVRPGIIGAVASEVHFTRDCVPPSLGGVCSRLVG